VFLGPNARLVKTIARKNPDVSDRLSHTHGTKVMKITKATYEMKNQRMSLFQFYSYIDGSLHVSGLQAHTQENSHNHWFSGCTVRATCTQPERYSH
jgi:hypothetical protein